MKRKQVGKSKRTATIGLRLHLETMSAIEAAAYDSHRGVGNWIECACLWALENGAVAKVPRPNGKDNG